MVPRPGLLFLSNRKVGSGSITGFRTSAFFRKRLRLFWMGSGKEGVLRNPNTQHLRFGGNMGGGGGFG